MSEDVRWAAIDSGVDLGKDAGWPGQGVLFDNVEGEWSAEDVRRSPYRKGRHWPIETLLAIDDYQSAPSRAGQPEGEKR